MEIVGVGTEIVECLRIGRMVEQHGEQFVTRVYTRREIHFCHERKRATEHFAARWAAKESVLKALSATWHKGLSMTDVEVHTERTGQLRVYLSGGLREAAQRVGATDFLLSLSHCRAYATAYVLAVAGTPVRYVAPG